MVGQKSCVTRGVFDVDIKDDDDTELGEDKDYIENPDDLSGDDFISTSADDASRSSDGSADDT